VKRLALLLLVFAFTGVASEVGEQKVKTAMVLSSTLPGAGQFYLGNPGGGFFALGTELIWWGGATAFLLAGNWAGSQDPTGTVDSLQALKVAMYIGSGVFTLAALGWRAVMVGQVHDDAVARNYRGRFLDFRAGLAPGLDGVKLGLYRRL
jgi:TM2 domain-containing membrane protein YozV